jgi:hypothetical protein
VRTWNLTKNIQIYGSVFICTVLICARLIGSFVLVIIIRSHGIILVFKIQWGVAFLYTRIPHLELLNGSRKTRALSELCIKASVQKLESTV